MRVRVELEAVEIVIASVTFGDIGCDALGGAADLRSHIVLFFSGKRPRKFVRVHDDIERELEAFQIFKTALARFSMRRIRRLRNSIGFPCFPVSLPTYLLAYDIVNAMTAFCACKRFSASSYTTDCALSITPSVTSILRSAGKGCI